MRLKKIILGSILITVFILIVIVYFYQKQVSTSSNINLTVNDSYIVNPKDFKTGHYYYDIENNKIASIDENGMIIALNPGSSKMYVKNSLGKTIKTYEINVTKQLEKPQDLVTGFELSPEVSLNSGELGEIKYNVYPTTSQPKIVWKSLDETIAIVDSNGKILGKKVGTTIIQGKINDYFIEESFVTITGVDSFAQNINSKINLDDSQLILNIGDKHKIKYSLLNINEPLIFTSNNDRVATVNNSGEITAIENGVATIIIMSQDKKISSSLKVSVENPIETQSISMYPENINIKVGQTYYLKAILLPLNSNQLINWTSSNFDVASINENGLVIGKKSGSAIITATVNGKSATCTVNVTEEPISINSIALNKSEITLKLKENYTLLAGILPSNAVAESITWTSSDSNVAIVSNSGIVTAKNVGSAIITATTNGGKSSTCKVSVVDTTTITIISQTANLYKGETLKLTATIFPSSESNQKIIWLSNNTSIASVDNFGNVTGKSAGIATITAKLNNGSSSNYTVKVLESYKLHFLKTTDQDGTNMHGDIIILESNGHFALIDAGYWWNYNNISTYLTGLGVKKLDFYLITHLHPDHLGAYNKIIPNYKPEKLYIKHYSGNDTGEDDAGWSQSNADTTFALQNRVISNAQSNNIPIVFVDEWADGQNYTYLGGTKIVFYNIRDRLKSGSKYYRKYSENINSIVSYINFNGKKIMLYGDLDTSEVVSYYANIIGNADIVKIGHHGINDDANYTIGSINNPSYAVVTNWWKGMSLSGIKGNIYFTGDYYSIVFNLSGENITVSTKK